MDNVDQVEENYPSILKQDAEPGDCIKEKGKVELNAISLGQDETELILHFNLCFEFPFLSGEDIKLFVCFDAKEVTVKIPRSHKFKFPNRMEVVFFSIVGELEN
ncbi:PREDICTED: 16 kDa beta-galactoside-binding lectin-like [Thamnophis sirtalis]|uniref:16 kDa beta-galactoside-binding lectin-like n=1 Tax=Thamnophis sirtalis TaxID=35019 RepID=A0A6I9Y7X8_9SAUR|nr:PREDICTED: 16 kDa beta-galactoside-binding lectin-like [Thamnophis sirtalis]